MVNCKVLEYFSSLTNDGDVGKDAMEKVCNIVSEYVTVVTAELADIITLRENIIDPSSFILFTQSQSFFWIYFQEVELL